MMSDEQEMHLAEILTQTKSLIAEKYRKGQAEHGGNLFDLSAEALINEAILEAVDQITYLLTAKQKMRAATCDGRTDRHLAFDCG